MHQKTCKVSYKKKISYLLRGVLYKFINFKIFPVFLYVV